MSKSFINSIFQEGGELTKEEKVKALNEISKAINKKMKIIEYEFKIKLKLNKLSESNDDCIPKKIGIQSFAQINGSIKGQIPFYTTAEIAMPSFFPMTTGIPLTPFGINDPYKNSFVNFIGGPFVGIQGLAINPYGTTADKLDERLKKAKETLTKIIEIRAELEALKAEGKPCTDSNPTVKKYFDCVDLKDEDDEELMKKISSILTTDK